MKRISQKEFDAILKSHHKWLKGRPGGKRADLSGTDLREIDMLGVDMRYAKMQDANMQGCKLTKCIGNGSQVKSMRIDRWDIVYTRTDLAIECEQHSIEEWRNFTDEEISKMNDVALEWWRKWKPFIFQAIEMSPAEE